MSDPDFEALMKAAPRTRYYLLDGHEPVPCYDVMEWATAYERFDGSHLANEIVGDVRISTVFLGIASPFSDPPLLFETMAFGPGVETAPMILHQRRVATWDEAIQEHEACVAAMRSRQGLPLH